MDVTPHIVNQNNEQITKAQRDIVDTQILIFAVRPFQYYFTHFEPSKVTDGTKKRGFPRQNHLTGKLTIGHVSNVN